MNLKANHNSEVESLELGATDTESTCGALTRNQPNPRRKLLYQWVLPITFGSFSFLYWFLAVPFVWSAAHTPHWPVLWTCIFVLAAFLLWLLTAAPCLWLWHRGMDTLVPVPVLPPVSAPFPTLALPVQPTPQTRSAPPTGGAIWIPAQTADPSTPALYTALTGRDSFQSGYRLDQDSEPTSDRPAPSNNTRRISESSVSSESSSAPALDQHCDPEDGLRDEPDSLPPLLERDDSFKGLPEMHHFNDYLHLVTVDTPASPREAFFGETFSNQTPTPAPVALRSRDPAVDLSEAQRRIAEARRSLPPMLCLPGGDISGVRTLRTVTLPPDPVRPQFGRSISAGTPSAAKTPHEPLDSVASEVHAELDEGGGVRRWGPAPGGRLVLSSSSAENQLEEEEVDPEGRFVVMKREYAANFLEAFIRLEQEALEREMAPAQHRPHSPVPEMGSQDSVFLEQDC